MMILSFEKLDQDNSVKLKQHAAYLDNTSFCSKTIVRTLDTHTHTGPIALPGPSEWSVKLTRIKPKPEEDALPSAVVEAFSLNVFKRMLDCVDLTKCCLF